MAMDRDTLNRYGEMARTLGNQTANGRTEIVSDMAEQMHRTEQQGFTRFCVAWLAALAEQPSCDMRNQASVDLAREFIKKIAPEKRALPYI